MDRVWLGILTFFVAVSCGRLPDTPDDRNSRNKSRNWEALPLAQELANQGFNCSRRPEGDICVISAVAVRGGFNYSQAIAILIPAGLSSPSKLHLYLHGFRGVCESAAANPEYFADSFALLPQLVSASSDSAIVFPMSSGQCATYNAELVPRFSALITWAEKLLHPSSSQWTIGGHSGAGSVISSALSKNLGFVNRVESIFLLDAAYSMGSHLAKWKSVVKTNPRIKIYSSYISGTSPATGSSQLKAGLPGSKVTITPSRAANHCTVPTKDYGWLLQRSLIDHWRRISRPRTNEEFIQPKPSLVM